VAGGEPKRESVTVLHDEMTWFHLAWSVAEAAEPPLETPLVTDLVEIIACAFGGEPEAYREEFREMTQPDYSQFSGGGVGGSNEQDDYTETDNSTLFGQIAADADSDSAHDGSVDGYSATHSSLDGGGSTNGTGDGDGPITQTGDHPRVAELNVLRRSYVALYKADVSLDQIQKKLATMREDTDNFWRPERGWTGHAIFDADELPAPDELGQPGKPFPTEAFDITDEGDAGYDILDLTGWAIRQVADLLVPDAGIDLDPYTKRDTLTPVPVEVKAVDPASPSFKFSLNQFQRAYQFVTADGEHGRVPYVLCLVAVSETGGDPKYSVDINDIIVVTCPADLRQLLPSELAPNANEEVVDTLILETIYGGDLMING
jgi:hypothetical protein